MNVVVTEGRGSQLGPIAAARTWLDDFGQVTLATVVSTWGSSPVPVGGQLVVAPGERFEGSVSGGCVEVDVISEAADVMATGRSKLLEFGVADETAWQSGLPCGGTMKIFLERLEGLSRNLIATHAVLAHLRGKRKLQLLFHEAAKEASH
jgi:xanthine dehydrogenase accessory factor